ncbi:MAG: 3-phosphoshikimate 1-carboxyvinyltransferase, partial [Clostridiales bacterium 43-6]
MISLNGKITVASDKSMSHRGIMLGSIATGLTKIENFLLGEDCLATIDCFRKLGVRIDSNPSEILVYGQGMQSLVQPNSVLYTGNSGTTTRLLAGLLSGYDMTCVIDGDESLQSRPMKRVIEPLTGMGATIKSKKGGFCPLTVKGGNLKGITYTLPVASAQLKSAIILAGINAEGETVIIENEKSRDHTENMLKAMGGDIAVADNKITVRKTEKLYGQNFIIPGDISSAAFFMVAALITPDSEVMIQNVGINPTRTGILDVLTQMGGDIRLENKRIICNEVICDIVVRSSKLHGVEVGGKIIPTLIDEIPIIAVAAAYAEGETVISDAKELRVKETDRIGTILEMLTVAGVGTEEFEDGFKVFGGMKMQNGVYNSYKDH